MVSVIIPLYNKKKVISRAIISILSQSYNDIEIIIVDDGSTDNSIIEIDRFHDTRIKVIRQNNKGPGAARNRGILASTGQYLAFLDADDEWDLRYLERSLEILEKYPNIDGTVTSQLIGNHKYDPANALMEKGYKPGVFSFPREKNFEKILRFHYLFHCDSIIIKKERLLVTDVFYDDFHCTYGEDIYLFSKFLFNYNIYRIFEPLTIYHTEESELASGRKSMRPLAPIFTNYAHLHNEINEDNRINFEIWLSTLALSRVSYYLDNDALFECHFLIKTFPKMKIWRMKYCKIFVRYLLLKIKKSID